MEAQIPHPSVPHEDEKIPKVVIEVAEDRGRTSPRAE